MYLSHVAPLMSRLEPSPCARLLSISFLFTSVIPKLPCRTFSQNILLLETRTYIFHLETATLSTSIIPKFQIWNLQLELPCC
ncbi:hypothetical protein MtrunA17_Chr3g0088101 [Medicago truncatula]|uniref:Uncharacterized protein n=1 Tax=Medicago truncatula TaxID=3880 RepID=A0A396IN62_MEDTR|nr:hypothetical protein MtrunA17_Chr3g0088101 [Medicago truncatula]